MAGAVSFLKLTDKLACQSAPAVYGVLHVGDLEAKDVQAIDDQESLTFSYARVDSTGSVRGITAQMKEGRVIAVVMEDGSVDREWRVGTVTSGRGERGRITVQCVPLWLDLVERSDSSGGKGWVSDIVGGARNFDYEITQRSPSSIFSAYIIPNCPSYVTLGTIDPTFVIPMMTANRLTPGALALAVRDILRGVDIPCEVQLRRNGTTDYKLDLVTQIGASANVPVFHPSISLLSLTKKSDSTLQATRVLMKGGTDPSGQPGQWGVARFRSGAPSVNTFALTDRNTGASPIAFDNEFVNWYLLRVKTGRTFQVTASSASGGTVTLGGGVSTIAADEDFEFRITEPLTNTRSTSTRYAVSAVPDGTHITMAVSVPIIANDQYVDWYAKVWSAASAGTVIVTTRITGSVAATDVIAVASSAGVTAAHFVEFVQLDGAGEVPSYVDHPIYAAADPVGYGIKVMELSRQALGVTDIMPNAWGRMWSVPANAPDGWTYVSGAGLSQNTNPDFTRYGGLSIRSNGGAVILSPAFYHATTTGNTTLSVRANLYAVSFDGSVLFEVCALKGDGTLGAVVASVKMGGPPYVGGDATLVAQGTWIEPKVRVSNIALAGDPASVATAPFGLKARITITNIGGVDMYVDAVEAYAFTDCPSEAMEFGDATALLQSGNNQLREVASPPLYYTIGTRDLERSLPTEYARLANTVGGNVRAADVEYGIDTTVRLLRRERDLVKSDSTQLTLSNRPTLLTSIQTASAARQNRIANAVVSGSSVATLPAFIVLAGATALPVGTEISTPVGAPVVTLPSAPPPAPGVEPTGAAVIFVPADPTTTPTTVVTVGKPPSRKRPPNESFI